MRASSSFHPKNMTLLHPGFQPGEYDVVCAKGKDVFQSPGNRHFRSLVKSQVYHFDGAYTKSEKGRVVSHIIDTVRCNSAGGFVKQVKGRWYRVNERMAREKVGSEFRNLLHTKYSSSTKAKARARCERQCEVSTGQPCCSPLSPIMMVSPETARPLRPTSSYNSSSQRVHDDENKHPLDMVDIDSMDVNLDSLFGSVPVKIGLDDEPLPLLGGNPLPQPVASSTAINTTNDCPDPFLEADLASLCDEWLQEGQQQQHQHHHHGQEAYSSHYYCSV